MRHITLTLNLLLLFILLPLSIHCHSHHLIITTTNRLIIGISHSLVSIDSNIRIIHLGIPPILPHIITIFFLGHVRAIQVLVISDALGILDMLG